MAGVRARLGELGVGAAEVVAPSDARRLVLAAVDDEWEAERLAAALRAEGELAVTRPDGGARLEGWMRDTRPITFGERLSVCFVWSEHDRGDLPRLIELGPGGFGSGQHPSTRLLVEELVGRIRGGERVLDVGCGSGVLGLCALGLGASRVVAVDITADAIEATRRNASAQWHGRASGGDARSARGDRGRLRRRRGERRQGGARRARTRARPARVAGRMARGQWDLALAVLARRRVPPSARGARAPNAR